MDPSLDVECVLNFCNTVRGQLGRQPVKGLRKGVPFDPGYCVVANTINFGCRKRVFVDSGTVDLGTDLVIAETPACVAALIRLFDGGRLPEYAGEGWAT